MKTLILTALILTLAGCAPNFQVEDLPGPVDSIDCHDHEDGGYECVIHGTRKA